MVTVTYSTFCIRSDFFLKIKARRHPPTTPHPNFFQVRQAKIQVSLIGERGGSVVECRTPEREVRGSRPTAAVLCP